MNFGPELDLDLDGLGFAARARPPVPDAETTRAVAAAVADGLGRRRKRLPPWLLYDQRGSALFEEITALPEYYLTRTERAIFAAHAGDILRAAGLPLSVIELGAGSAAKTRLLLQALIAEQPRGDYMPVDVSPAALAEAARQLRDLPRLHTRPVMARYPDELGFLRGVAGRRLVLFLGSNIGNYDARAARALLSAVCQHLGPGDALLIGTDLRKSARYLVPAYDDASGVTARFIKNVLDRLNRELGATFAPDCFRHVAIWNRTASRMEMYLESLVPQRVRIAALDLTISFAAGERIHTESSYKFTRGMVRDRLRSTGLRLESTWHDPRRWFAVHLCRVTGTATERSSRTRSTRDTTSR